jgi:hypothetical protein
MRSRHPFIFRKTINYEGTSDGYSSQRGADSNGKYGRRIHQQEEQTPPIINNHQK